DYGQAMTLHRIISKTLLDGSVEKKHINPTKLFQKGLEELDAALADRRFVEEYVPAAKHGQVEAFRNLLRKTWGRTANLTRDEAAKQIGEIAMAAARDLNLSPTVTAMEFACGSCY